MSNQETLPQETVVAFNNAKLDSPCVKVHKLRSVDDHGNEIWCDWCYKHHHWLNGEHGVTRDACDELIDDLRRTR